MHDNSPLDFISLFRVLILLIPSVIGVPHGFAQEFVDFSVVSITDCDERGFVEVTGDVHIRNYPLGRQVGLQLEHVRDTILVWTGSPMRVTLPALANREIQDLDLFSIGGSPIFVVRTNILPLAICPNACRIESATVVAFGPCEAGFVETTIEIDYANPNGASLMEVYNFQSESGFPSRVVPVTGSPQRVTLPIRAVGQELDRLNVAVGMDGCFRHVVPLGLAVLSCPQAGCGIRDVSTVSVACDSTGGIEVVVAVDFFQPVSGMAVSFGNQTSPLGLTSPVLFTNRYAAAGQLVMEQVASKFIDEFSTCRDPYVWSMTMPDCRCELRGVRVDPENGIVHLDIIPGDGSAAAWVENAAALDGEWTVQSSNWQAVDSGNPFPAHSVPLSPEAVSRFFRFVCPGLPRSVRP